jgi:hypothetical protein
LRRTDGNAPCETGGRVVGDGRRLKGSRARCSDVCCQLWYQVAAESLQVSWVWLLPFEVSRTLKDQGSHTYITAANKHAGGVAAAKLARAVMAAKMKVEVRMMLGVSREFEASW